MIQPGDTVVIIRPERRAIEAIPQALLDHKTAEVAYEFGILDEKPQKVKFPPDIETQGGSKQ